jgi:hypothetical protein
MTLHVISLGAGVQSTTMALMAAHGEITPMPDCAIFADTGWEPKAVYRHLEWLMSPNVLPFPVHIVSAGNLRESLIARSSGRSERFLTVPFFLKHPDGSDGIGRRQCTSHYKIEPIHKKLRDLLGAEPRQRIAPGSVESWIGISLDEIIRATPSKVRYAVRRFPLLEHGMRRHDCLTWLRAHDYPAPPKSSCIGCPYHNNDLWREMKDSHPEEWADAVAMDKIIRKPIDRPGTQELRGEQFMHRSLKPLDEVDLSTAEDRGQLNLFINECEGMCGV